MDYKKESIYYIYYILQSIILVGEVFSHAEEECSHVVEIHVEVTAEAHAVFEDGYVVPLQALECAVVVESAESFMPANSQSRT